MAGSVGLPQAMLLTTPLRVFIVIYGVLAVKVIPVEIFGFTFSRHMGKMDSLYIGKEVLICCMQNTNTYKS